MRSLVILLTAALLVGCTSQRIDEEASYTQLRVISPAFGEGEKIPVDYTCDGFDVNPQLNISDVPDDTVSLALIVEDPDAPLGVWDHWVVYNIPPAGGIGKNSTPGTEGMNSFGRKRYGGPCPPLGTHRYVFSIYALDAQLALGDAAGKKEVLEAMIGHILAKGQLTGVYNH
jgi:Raf kinase inhibitor-like YbhB/YbcL family protein